MGIIGGMTRGSLGPAFHPKPIRKPKIHVKKHIIGGMTRGSLGPAFHPKPIRKPKAIVKLGKPLVHHAVKPKTIVKLGKPLVHHGFKKVKKVGLKAAMKK